MVTDQRMFVWRRRLTVVRTSVIVVMVAEACDAGIRLCERRLCGLTVLKVSVIVTSTGPVGTAVPLSEIVTAGAVLVVPLSTTKIL